MKKINALFLLVVFLVCLSGCVVPAGNYYNPNGGGYNNQYFTQPQPQAIKFGPQQGSYFNPVYVQNVNQ